MSSLLVECQPGDDGGLVQRFNLEVYIAEQSSHLHSNHSSSQPNFIVSSLTPGTKYSLVLYATNAKGRSHTVALTAITLMPPEKHTARGNVVVRKSNLKQTKKVGFAKKICKLAGKSEV